MAEPPAKKTKTEETVFEKCWKNKLLLGILEEHLADMKTKDFCLCLLKIKHCNACEGYSFSNAYCKTEKNVVNKDGETCLDAYYFSTIFMRGYTLLKDYIDKMQIPHSRKEKVMLEKLLSVFMDLKYIEDGLKNVRLDLSTKEWTIALAHHLLKNLSISENYIIDNHYPRCSYQCSCCQQPITGIFGDTSIGSTAVWHGYVDMILGTGVSVAAGDARSKDEEFLEGNESAFEVKQAFGFPEKCRGQLIAQTIVFSFLQKKTRKYDNYLIPSIGISKSEVPLFLYDCENDILLEGKPFQLWIDQGNVIDRSGVIALWLAINYSLTCSGVTEHMKKNGFTADFFRHVGKELKIYQEGIKLGCGAGVEVKERFEPRGISHLDLH